MRRNLGYVVLAVVCGLAVATNPVVVEAAGRITGAQIKDGTIATADVRNQSLLARDFEPGQLPAGPRGPAGRSALSPLRSGETISGTWALSGGEQGFSTGLTGVTFPVPAPVPVDSEHAVIAGNDTVAGDGCTGTASEPVAAPGFVCLYPVAFEGTTSGAGVGGRSDLTNGFATGDGVKSGFIVNASGIGNWYTSGVWIYKAP